MNSFLKPITLIWAVAFLSCSTSHGAPLPAALSSEDGSEKKPGAVKEADDEEYGGTLALKPLGDVPDQAISTASAAIRDVYGWKVVLDKKAELPQIAWYKPRKRWRAEKILAWITPRMPVWADKIMAITVKDISTTKPPHEDWGICGLADLDGPAAVVSTYRIKKKLGKLTPKERKKKYLQRLRDLAAHEFGHQLCLEHCPNKGCIMEDAKGTVLTFDHSTSMLCDDCKKILVGRGLYKTK